VFDGEGGTWGKATLYMTEQVLSIL
jgi:hypothetical protein